MAHLNKQSNTDQLPRRANNKRAATSQYRFENDTVDDEDVSMKMFTKNLYFVCMQILKNMP